MRLAELFDKLPMLAGHYDPETGKPITGTRNPQREAVAAAIAFSFDPFESDFDQLQAARCEMLLLRNEAQNVVNALESTLQHNVNGLDMRAELDLAPASDAEPDQVQPADRQADQQRARRLQSVLDDLRPWSGRDRSQHLPDQCHSYSQTCHDCGQVLVEGWNCEIFPAPESRWAVIRLNKDGLPEVDYMEEGASRWGEIIGVIQVEDN